MLDRDGGICGGKSGSMHLSDRSHYFLGASSIVASQLSIAAGVAMSEKANGSGRAVVVFCGDGALGAGVAFESVMIAQRLGLPLLVVCEDNGWQDHTPSEVVMPIPPADLLTRLGLPTQRVDGNSVLDVAAIAQTALAECRRGAGPRAVVAQTFLRHFHSQLADDVPNDYRPPEQVRYWLSRDPLDLAASRLRETGVDPEPIRHSAIDSVGRAVVGTLAAPRPDPRQACTAITATPWPPAHIGG
jgi:TPP-dependent pyruvate/acetoin dehydrogenase alpha subunit